MSADLEQKAIARLREGRGEWYISAEGRRLGAGDGVADMFAPPVQPGDAVYIREPWYRLKSPQGGDSERVILAADCVVAEDQVSYKWASPVSMPEDAARRFARVKSIGAAYGETVTPAWMIELETIGKEEALAADAGVPFSTATDPEEGSTYLTYAGDMSVEDHERMIAAINADRARLYEVQNRLIRIDLRRRELSSLMFEERDKVDPNDRAALEAENTALDEEQGNLSREESDLRAALEDAGAPAPTIEEHARELLTTIDARLRECDAADNEDRAEYNIGEEERDLIAERDVLTAYLSANNVEETPERAEGGISPSDPHAGEAAAKNTAAAEDEEIGSFTIGKCKYCGREWGVTLEGAREGGFPTQRTADAAATRLCDCEEAVANRAPIVGVAKNTEKGWITAARRYAGDPRAFYFDCVGLIKALLWGWNGDASKAYGGAIYPTMNQVLAGACPDVSADGMISICSDVSTDFSGIVPGAAVWMSGHIGIYVGDGLAVECTPSWKNGVQITAVANIGKKSGYNARTWKKWGKIPYVTYEEAIDMSKDELKALIRETVKEVLNEENPVYKDLKDVPDCWKGAAAALLDAGAVNGGTPAEVCATDLNLRKETLKAAIVAVMYHEAREGAK